MDWTDILSLFERFFKDKNEYLNMELTLSRIDNALLDINFIENRLGKIIHIAGTNGKGSTAYFIQQLLLLNGLNIALFTSPHILDITERININDRNICSEEFDDIFKSIKHIVVKNSLSYFEAIFLIAIIYFSKNLPDITILETGLGGTFDATNCKAISNKVAVITSLSYDHENILGKNIYKIINEKLGIIRPNSTLFLAKNKIFIEDYIKSKLEVISISNYEITKNQYFKPYDENYSTAKVVAEYILGRKIEDNFNLKLPQARLETIENITFDGSHNPSGVIALIKNDLDAKYIIFALTKDRNLSKMYNLLKSSGKNIILTSIPDNSRSISFEDAKQIDCKFIEDPIEALNFANYKENKVIVSGSFYLCGYIKKKLGLL